MSKGKPQHPPQADDTADNTTASDVPAAEGDAVPADDPLAGLGIRLVSDNEEEDAAEQTAEPEQQAPEPQEPEPPKKKSRFALPSIARRLAGRQPKPPKLDPPAEPAEPQDTATDAEGLVEPDTTEDQPKSRFALPRIARRSKRPTPEPGTFPDVGKPADKSDDVDWSAAILDTEWVIGRAPASETPAPQTEPQDPPPAPDEIELESGADLENWEAHSALDEQTSADAPPPPSGFKRAEAPTTPTEDTTALQADLPEHQPDIADKTDSEPDPLAETGGSNDAEPEPGDMVLSALQADEPSADEQAPLSENTRAEDLAPEPQLMSPTDKAAGPQADANATEDTAPKGNKPGASELELRSLRLLLDGQRPDLPPPANAAPTAPESSASPDDVNAAECDLLETDPELVSEQGGEQKPEQLAPVLGNPETAAPPSQVDSVDELDLSVETPSISSGEQPEFVVDVPETDADASLEDVQANLDEEPAALDDGGRETSSQFEQVEDRAADAAEGSADSEPDADVTTSAARPDDADDFSETGQGDVADAVIDTEVSTQFEDVEFVGDTSDVPTESATDLDPEPLQSLQDEDDAASDDLIVLKAAPAEDAEPAEPGAAEFDNSLAADADDVLAQHQDDVASEDRTPSVAETTEHELHSAEPLDAVEEDDPGQPLDRVAASSDDQVDVSVDPLVPAQDQTAVDQAVLSQTETLEEAPSKDPETESRQQVDYQTVPERDGSPSKDIEDTSPTEPIIAADENDPGADRLPESKHAQPKIEPDVETATNAELLLDDQAETLAGEELGHEDDQVAEGKDQSGNDLADGLPEKPKAALPSVSSILARLKPGGLKSGEQQVAEEQSDISASPVETDPPASVENAKTAEIIEVVETPEPLEPDVAGAAYAQNPELLDNAAVSEQWELVEQASDLPFDDIGEAKEDTNSEATSKLDSDEAPEATEGGFDAAEGLEATEGDTEPEVEQALELDKEADGGSGSVEETPEVTKSEADLDEETQAADEVSASAVAEGLELLPESEAETTDAEVNAEFADAADDVEGDEPETPAQGVAASTDATIGAELDADEWDESVFEIKPDRSARKQPDPDAEKNPAKVPEAEPAASDSKQPAPARPKVADGDPGAGWLTAQAYEASSERRKVERPPPADVSVPKVKPAASAAQADGGDALTASLRLALGTGIMPDKPPAPPPEPPPARRVRKQNQRTRPEPARPVLPDQTPESEPQQETRETPTPEQADQPQPEQFRAKGPVEDTDTVPETPDQVSTDDEQRDDQDQQYNELPDPRFTGLETPLTPRVAPPRPASWPIRFLRFWFRFFKRLALVIPGTYIIICVVMFTMQRDLQYPGMNLPPITEPTLIRDQIGPSPVEITTSDDLALTSWIVPPAEGKPVILLAHGNGETPAKWFDRARQWREDRGWGMMIIGYRGYAGNPGSPTEEDLLDDARRNRAWLASNYPRNPVILFGQSLGSGVMMGIAADRVPVPPAAIVLEAPYTSIPDVARQFWGWLPVDLLMLDQFRSIDRIGDVTIPVLIYHGKRDLTIPWQMGKQLYDEADAARERHIVLVDQGGHSDLYEYHSHVSRLFEKLEAVVFMDEWR